MGLQAVIRTVVKASGRRRRSSSRELAQVLHRSRTYPKGEAKTAVRRRAISGWLTFENASEGRATPAHFCEGLRRYDREFALLRTW